MVEDWDDDTDDDPDGDEAEPIDLGPCCVCGKEDKTVRNIEFLDKKVPPEHRDGGIGCWGCPGCGLPMEGGAAVRCDECAETREPARFALGRDKTRIPVEQLVGYHTHDYWLHEEVPKHLVDFPEDVWMTAADGCQWCKAAYVVRLTNIDAPRCEAAVEYRLRHLATCPDYMEGEEVESEWKDAGWTFQTEGDQVRGVEIGGRFYPRLAWRGDVGPCLCCWRLIVDVPLMFFIGEGDDMGQMDFCVRCAETTGILGLMRIRT